MPARGTSADCADSSSSCFDIASARNALALLTLLLTACGNARPPPPAQLDPGYADAGPPIILHDPWPQTGPFSCHGVTARDGTRTAMCSRSGDACESWREANAKKGYEVDACVERLEASCLLDGARELCFDSMASCEDMREALRAAGRCKTIRAVWKPE